jgi:hypothetical protein
MQGSPSGLISCTISFSSASPSEKVSSNFTGMRDDFSADFIPYWWSGNSYVRDWTLSFNQSVTPKFANKNLYKMTNDRILASSPLYLFVGEIDVNLDFTCFCPLVSDKVNVSTSSFKINGRTSGSGYSMGGQNDLGMYKYSILSHALGSNDGEMLVIS